MRRDSAWAMAHRPRVATFSAYNSTVPSGKLNLFWTTLVSSRILLPFSPSTFCVRVAMMMISVRVGVTRTYHNIKSTNHHSAAPHHSNELPSESGCVLAPIKRWLVALGSHTPRTTKWLTWVFGDFAKQLNHKYEYFFLNFHIFIRSTFRSP